MEFTIDEITLLREILASVRADLKEEIYKTEGTGYRKLLKQREQTLDVLMSKLSGEMPSSGPESLHGPHVTSTH